MATRPIAEIKVGQRHRIDYGDIDGLAKNIADIGLLHPVVIRPDGKLIAGARRLRAFKLLERDKIPVTVIDLEKVVLGEYAENTFRKAFTPSEVVAVADAVEPIERAKAKERQAEGQKSGGRGKRKNIAGNSRKVKREPTALDKVAKATGKDRKTVQKAREVVRAAEAEPEKFGSLLKDMDESGKVDRAFSQLKIKQARADYEARADRGAKVADLVAMAEAGQKSAVITGDPAWEHEVYSGHGKQRSAERYYDVSSLDAIKALPVAPLAADDCTLFLWCTWPHLTAGLEVIKAWGFEYKTVGFIWIKTTKNAEALRLDGDGLHWGLGYWTRANTEICLLATKGNPVRIDKDVHQVVIAPVGEHSVKPDEVHKRIERLLNGPYLELFARRPVEGWTIWGNEIQRVDEAAE